MKRIILMATTTLFFTGAALADNNGGLPIRNLPDKGRVTVSGTVETVKSEREFVLRDNSGSVDSGHRHVQELLKVKHAT